LLINGDFIASESNSIYEVHKFQTITQLLLKLPVLRDAELARLPVDAGQTRLFLNMARSLPAQSGRRELMMRLPTTS